MRNKRNNFSDFGRSGLARTRALLATLAPWTLAGAALVSFTASAGQQHHVLDQEFRRSAMIEPQRLTLSPPRTSKLNAAIRAAQGVFDEKAPEAAQSATSVLPHIRKVDLARELGMPSAMGTPLLFSTDKALMPGGALQPAITLHYASQLLVARLSRFEGRTIDSSFFTGASGDVYGQGASPQVLTRSRPDGGTPMISRAARLASVTPAPVEPEVIASVGMAMPAFAQVHASTDGAKVETAALKLSPDYLHLINPEAMAQEQKCLAEAVYFEARSEPEAGQAGVAQVVLNRVKSGLYPTSICGVVYQNRHKYKACQFTFACEGKRLVPNDANSWENAQRIARSVLEGEQYNARIGTATHYHATYVAPYWSRKLKRNGKVGRHIFYSLRPGQT